MNVTRVNWTRIGFLFKNEESPNIVFLFTNVKQINYSQRVNGQTV
jgi:hypothetical protein